MGNLFMQEWLSSLRRLFLHRFALSYKGIPFETKYFEFPDLPKAIEALGAPPTSILPDGKPRYTTPAIIDNKTGKVETNSTTVAEYLDTEYPDTPRLFPPGTAAAIHMFEQVFEEQVASHLGSFMFHAIYDSINPESKPFFRETREVMFNCKFEDILPKEERPEHYRKFCAGLSKIAAYWEKNGKDKLFFLGDTFSHADCIVGGWFMFAKRVLDHEEWEMIAQLDGGRWAKLVEYCEELESAAAI